MASRDRMMASSTSYSSSTVESSTSGACTDCTDPANQHMLSCSKCNRATHYTCTRLPAYWLFHIIKKEEKEEKKLVGKKKGKFTCQACTGVVPPDVASNSVESRSIAYTLEKSQVFKSANLPEPIVAKDNLSTEYKTLKKKYAELLIHNQASITELARHKKKLLDYKGA